MNWRFALGIWLISGPCIFFALCWINGRGLESAQRKAEDTMNGFIFLWCMAACALTGAKLVFW